MSLALFVFPEAPRHSPLRGHWPEPWLVAVLTAGTVPGSFDTRNKAAAVSERRLGGCHSLAGGLGGTAHAGRCWHLRGTAPPLPPGPNQQEQAWSPVAGTQSLLNHSLIRPLNLHRPSHFSLPGTGGPGETKSRPDPCLLHRAAGPALKSQTREKWTLKQGSAS